MDNITFPVIDKLSVGILIDNFLPNAEPFADINFELAYVLRRTRNLHLLCHLQQLDEKHYRLWRIEDWTAIKEIADEKRKEQQLIREANIVLSEKFMQIRDALAAKIGTDTAHKFASLMFSASSETERNNIASVLGVDLTPFAHLFDNKPASYEVVVSYKGKNVKLW